jgi:hypothetical protein
VYQRIAKQKYPGIKLRDQKTHQRYNPRAV